jgi:hypothetical protein
MIDSGSIDIECSRRLSNLYIESHTWLIREAKKITKNKEEAEDLVQELFEYLHTKQNPKLWWGNTSYNLFYCNKFLHSRFMNKVRKLNRTTYVEVMPDREDDVPYDEERDLLLQRAHEQIVNQLKQLSITKQWPQAKIFELYWMSPDTLDEVSNKIGISKSTTFLAVKKIRKYLENTLDDPFK